MVSRWGLEALTDLFIHDNKDYSFPLLNAVASTLHPQDAARIRAHLEKMRSQGISAAGPFPETPTRSRSIWRFSAASLCFSWEQPPSS